MKKHTHTHPYPINNPQFSVPTLIGLKLKLCVFEAEIFEFSDIMMMRQMREEVTYNISNMLFDNILFRDT